MTIPPNNDRIAECLDKAIGTDLEGLSKLQAAMQQPALKEALAKSVECLMETEGRLVLSGIGKSGHVARKLAATFSSTGTPAYFIHGAEASHGDLGGVRSDDAVMVLSWSGGTKEMSDLVAYTRRFQIPLIVMTGNAAGPISQAADICIALPTVREACPHNLAPTTSTLMQMAAGDAVAVTLLEIKGFSQSSFHDFHPGGKLGAALRTIDDILVTGDDMPLLDVTAIYSAVVDAISRGGLGIVGIVDEAGLLTGVVTDGDIRRSVARSLDEPGSARLDTLAAVDIMTRDPVVIEPGTLAGKALNVLQTRRISATFSVSDGVPTGVLTTLRLLEEGVA